MAEEISPQRKVPQLNQRILSSLSRRSVAAHPWHDLEIGTDAIKDSLIYQIPNTIVLFFNAWY